jgi:transcription-repair coupling factor (superfamily II helicase)
MPIETKDQNLDHIAERLGVGVPAVHVSGIFGAARAFFLARLVEAVKRPTLIVLPQARDADRLHRELEFFLSEPSDDFKANGERRLFDFPPYDISPLSGLSPHGEVIARRLEALYALTSNDHPVVVTSTEASLLRTLPKEGLIGALEYLETGEEIERARLLERLEIGGYLRTSLVEELGDYAVRGGVVDVYPPLYGDPVRLEFWGDQLESIRYFDPLSQRSRDPIKELVLLPASEIVFERENVERARSMGRLPNPTGEGRAFPGHEGWVNHFYGRLDTVFDYFPQNGLVILLEPHRQEMERNRFEERHEREVEKYRQEAAERGAPFPETEGLLMSAAETGARVAEYQQVNLSRLAMDRPGDASANALRIEDVSEVGDDLDLQLAGKGRVSMAPLAEKISEWINLGSRVILVCRTEQQAQRLREILANYQVEVDEFVSRWDRVSRGVGLSICIGRLSRGFAWPSLGICVVSEDEIFGAKRRHRSSRRVGEAGLNWTSFSQLKDGDLVVHQDHGIGRYGGLRKMEIKEKVNDFAIIEYAHSDRLYVPADRISVLQKYVGADEQSPKLDQLGGRSWDLVKQKAKKSIREIAKQLIEIYAVRKYRKGFAFSAPDNTLREFEATFEHEETPDQVKAIEEVLADMCAERPMDRLICGDVGYGKTEVAIRAAFKAAMDGKQTALLVPTTVLAEQHYETFSKRLGPYGIDVAVLSRFKARTEQKEILAEVRSAKIDVLIGTHRILQKDVSFRDFGLLIIDEEQRFGVKQKEILKRYRALVDVLALTATPIPRTLHLSLMGIRDLSIIETPPEDRLAIQSYLSPYDEPTIKDAIEFELERRGQVFFVHNRVQTIGQIADGLMQLVPQARFAVAHGQMKARELEETMIRFLQKEIDILVCTTIIEAGLDIPTVNTIIINEVDRFGLSQLYQLRGRVGRSKENAYAYLLLSNRSELSHDAEKRLRALMDFSHLGAGIHLAMHDLRIRGGGNILGFSQSGHISAIGYELYLKMVEQSIAELRGEDWHEEVNPEINVNTPAYLPAEYVSDTDVRLNLYRRLSSLRERSELEAMTEEMHDRFGPTPREVSNLLAVMAVRLILKRVGIARLDISAGSLLLTFAEHTRVKPETLVNLVRTNPGRYRFLSEKKLKIKLDSRRPLDSLREAERIIPQWEAEKGDLETR